MTSEQPILPWAANAGDKTEASPAAPDYDMSEVEHLTLETVGLATGDRIEVKWEIESEGKSELKWWGAKIIGELKAEDGVDAPTTASKPLVQYQLDYDPYGEDFQESEVQPAIFTSHRTLMHSQDEGYVEMYWRKEGDTWEDDEDSQEPVSLDDVIQENFRELSSEGELFQGLDPFQKRVAATAIGELAQHFRNFVAAKVQGSNSDQQVVISVSDVETFFESVKNPQSNA